MCTCCPCMADLRHLLVPSDLCVCMGVNILASHSTHTAHANLTFQLVYSINMLMVCVCCEESKVQQMNHPNNKLTAIYGKVTLSCQC